MKSVLKEKKILVEQVISIRTFLHGKQLYHFLFCIPSTAENNML